jgi:drug/metabolite transporter (DMT)-like permease
MSRSGEGKTLKPPVGVLAGAVFGLSAAVLYTLSNIALRQSVTTDPFLVSAVKAAPTVVFLGPFVLWMRARGQPLATSTRMIPRFAAAALVAQFGGNAMFQIALGIIGLAATVPIVLGLLIIGGAVLGRWLLGEPVRPRTVVAIVTLITAVVILSRPGSETAETPSATSPSLWVGGLCAAVAGTSYALFGTVLRQTLNGGMSAPATMLISGVIGTVTLWSVTFARIGLEPVGAITAGQWAVMSLAGVFNFTAFISLSLSLKALPVVAVNLINASQVAMAAVAGIVLFGEPITLPLVSGIALTVAGLLVLASRRRPKQGGR